ncbi:MAG: NUDIX domain-containing protein [Bacilli bacterium]
MNIQFGQNDGPCTFVVIVAEAERGIVWVYHSERKSYELPGGRIELGETPLAAAKRELYEETGARTFTIEAVDTIRTVPGDDEPVGMLYHATIHAFEAKPPSEIQFITITHSMPEPLTYSELQPQILHYVQNTKKR